MHRFSIVLVLFATVGLLLPAAHAQTLENPQSIAPNLDISKLDEDLWMHTSWRTVPGFGRVPSHGLVVISEGKALLVDTAWGDSLTRSLLDWIENDLAITLERAVVTHAHDDRMGGLATLQAAGVITYAHTLTAEDAPTRGLPAPDSLLQSIDHLTVGARTIETFYPGPGHTRDNLVVWLPDQKLLFGGCLLKAAEHRTMGYTGDADLVAWPTSIQNLLDRYTTLDVVLPSHGVPGGANLLHHTLYLLNEHAKKQVGG